MAEMSRIGKYEIRRELGRGAMGVVYEAYDPMIKRIVALKTIRADQLAGDNAETVVARFRREAQAAGRLSHPGIVSIYDVGEDNGVWYIAMEFVQGRELKDHFEANERFAPPDIVRIMTQILDALGYSHRLGVIHRDVKPANVILLPGGGVKVADFGIAHIESSNMTQVGTVLGTPSYMSPEQIMGLPVDGRSDLFSAGVILYQFLTGERPFSGSATATMHKVLEEDPLPPSRFNVQVPGAMDAVVRKALAKRPDERYQSAEEFAAALADAARRQDSAAEATVLAAPEPPRPAPADAARSEPSPAPGPQGGTVAPAPASADTAGASRQQKSQTPAILIAAALAVVALGAGVWVVYQRAPTDAAKIAQAPAAPAANTMPPMPPSAGSPPAASMMAPGMPPGAPTAPAAAAPKDEPGSVTVAAQGLVDPQDPRYGADKALLQSDLRADAKRQLVAKALGLMVEEDSLAKHYDIVRDKLLPQSGTYISTVVRESAPRLGKDGLMSMTAEAVVDVRALQKSLNQMSRDERVDFIRASGDPKISVRIAVRDADRPDAPPQPSPVAENLLKERIKAFGFRTWSADDDRGAGSPQGADFVVQGEAQVKKLSARLAASGVVITKYTLASWTVKCLDRATGEEIYYNTTLPKATGSWASEGEAMQAIGGKIADEFSRNFFLQHVTVSGRKVTLTVDGMPDTPDDVLLRELIGLPAVITVVPRVNARPHSYDLQLAGTGPQGDLVANGVLKALNAKLGQACFALGRIAGDEVNVAFDKGCSEAAILSRLETNPPAGLYAAPPSRQKALIRDPETLRRLTI
jgi:tRNA A-37 threonylcarbamoyl transferase component Bud32